MIFETTIGYVIDTFKFHTPDVIQKFVQKNQLESSTCHRVSYSKVWYVNNVFPAYAMLLPSFIRNFHSKQRKIEHVPAKKLPFSTISSGSLNFRMTSKSNFWTK